MPCFYLINLSEDWKVSKEEIALSFEVRVKERFIKLFLLDQ